MQVALYYEVVVGVDVIEVACEEDTSALAGCLRLHDISLIVFLFAILASIV